MKNLVTILFTLLVACWIPAQAENKPTKALTWFTSYEEAVTQAKASNKPIVILFTGSDWCPLCIRLEKEVFDTQEFALAAGDKYIFMKVDTPINTPLPEKLKAQNKELQKKFNIRQYPTVIVLDSQQRQLGITGYISGGGKAYAQHLAKIVADHLSYQAKMDDLSKKKLSSAELKELYLKAKELDRISDAVQIVNLGMDEKDNLFFLIERYRFLADEGQIFDKEAIGLRKRILETDPENKLQTHYQVAVVDFEAACEEMEKENFSPEIAVAPLVSYIEKFGKQDRDNLWRLEMIISQVYFEKNKLTEALKYAQASYESAPTPARADIATAIKNIQSQLETN